MNAINARLGSAPAARFAFVAFRVAGIVEIIAASPLQQVPSHGRHVSKLLRSACEDGFTQNRVALANQGVISGIGIGDKCSDSEIAFVFLNLVQRHAGNVYQVRGTLDSHLHEVKKVGTAADIAGF